MCTQTPRRGHPLVWDFRNLQLGSIEFLWARVSIPVFTVYLLKVKEMLTHKSRLGYSCYLHQNNVMKVTPTRSTSVVIDRKPSSL